MACEAAEKKVDEHELLYPMDACIERPPSDILNQHWDKVQGGLIRHYCRGIERECLLNCKGGLRNRLLPE